MLETFAPFVVVALAALLVGIKLGRDWSRRLLWIALIASVVCFVIYAFGLNYSRSAGDLHWLRGVAQSVATVSYGSLYVASGLLGPAVAKPIAIPVMMSAVATLAALTLGTWLMMFFGCAFASDCI